MPANFQVLVILHPLYDVSWLNNSYKLSWHVASFIEYFTQVSYFLYKFFSYFIFSCIIIMSLNL